MADYGPSWMVLMSSAEEFGQTGHPGRRVMPVDGLWTWTPASAFSQTSCLHTDSADFGTTILQIFQPILKHKPLSLSIHPTCWCWSSQEFSLKHSNQTRADGLGKWKQNMCPTLIKGKFTMFISFWYRRPQICILKHANPDEMETNFGVFNFYLH